MSRDFFDPIRNGHGLFIMDGAMGTLLSTRGWRPPSLPEEMNMKDPDAVFDIHQEYLRSGAQIIETNSFGANPIKLAHRGLLDETEAINERAARLARRAADPFGATVAGCMGPLGDLLEPLGLLSFEEAYGAYKKQAEGLFRGGVDFFLIETQLDLQEAKAAVLAVKDVAPRLPFVVSFTFEKNGRTVTGTPPEVIAHWARQIGAAAVGTNCGFGPDLAEGIVKTLYENAGIPVFAYPNAGTPGGREFTPEEFAKESLRLAQLGAGVVGGCCGTTPEYVVHLKERLKGLTPLRPVEIQGAVLASRTRLVRGGLDEPILVIGERINVSRKSPLREEVAQYRWETLFQEAQKQAQNGASVIDINISLPSLDRRKAMREAVKTAERACTLPLSIDADETEVLEEGLLCASGIALINSVTAVEKKLLEGIQLAKRFGACLVVLAIDENGIATTSEGREEAAKKACRIAEEAHFPKNRMFLDPLTMSVAADTKAGIVTLDVLRKFKKEGLLTVMGISNVSHGLPERAFLNRSFFAMAAGAGLDAVIANPLDADFPPLVAACNLLSGRDRAAASYIAWSHTKKGREVEKSAFDEKTPSLNPIERTRVGVVRGDLEGALEGATSFLSQGEPPLNLIQDALLPALEEVGRLYECGDYFLPQLISSAQAAQGVCNLVEEALARCGQTMRHRGNIVMATVAGDIHDIGKNIVSMVLKSHGFYVTDLGKDVPLERILAEARKGKAHIIGLSALMTTTLFEMERVVKEIKKERLPVKVITGGAAVSQSYSEEIGADGYATDALGAVRLVEKLLKKAGESECK